MSKVVLLILGAVLLLMALLGSFPSLTTVTEPTWHIVMKWIGGIIAVGVALFDKKEKKKT
ncbi:MAG TPA: hypothetical protein DCE14_00815 [Kosmotogaceae bacterium]|nr:MAG: hypothetical protein XE05_0759 [Thermotogales bacterium 46_20]HAA84883.1 hypothetical protein [Kosmotogaceae bacterium]